MNNATSYIREISIPETEKEDYPFSIPIVKNFGSIELHNKVTYFVGENGSGKSTILEALAIALRFNPEGGTRNTIFSTHQTESSLWETMRITKGMKTINHGFFFRAETMYNLFSKAESEKDDPHGWHIYGWQGMHARSHGEGHLKLFEKKMRKGFYLLDEPEAALSPEKQMSFLTLLDNLIANESQVVICTHSPIILAYPDSWIYSFDSSAPKKIEYSEAKCVEYYDLFFKKREVMLSELLSNKE